MRLPQHEGMVAAAAKRAAGRVKIKVGDVYDNLVVFERLPNRKLKNSIFGGQSLWHVFCIGCGAVFERTGPVLQYIARGKINGSCRHGKTRGKETIESRIAKRLERINSTLARGCHYCGVKNVPFAWFGDVVACADCKNKAWKKLRDKRRGYTGTSVLSLPILLVRDGEECQLCHKRTPITFIGTNRMEAPTIGHIVPRVRGGPDTYENARVECRMCNSSKGRRLDAELRGRYWESILEQAEDTLNSSL